MQFDFNAHLGATIRSVAVLERDGKPVRGVTLERTYDTTDTDLWDAVTNPTRLPRWFAPVRGELRLGGRFQIEGNASGTVTQCDPPRSFSLTWEFGGETSWVEVRVEPAGADRARLTLCHLCPVDDHWRKYGPGAAGIGWELGLFGLALHIGDPNADRPDDAAFFASSDAKAFILGASERWGRAAMESGENPTTATGWAERTAAFYTGAEHMEG